MTERDSAAPPQGSNEAGSLFSRVLMVEDDPAHAHLVRRALKGLVEEVVHHESLAGAIEYLSKQRPDLIITDLNLPDGNPSITVMKLRERAPLVPLVVLTSSNSLRDAVEVMRTGADDFVVKDFDSDFREVLGFTLRRLKERTALLLVKEKLEREMQALRAAIESGADGLAVADMEGAVGYANSAFREYVQKMGGSPEELGTLLGQEVKDRERQQRAVQEKMLSMSPGSVWSTEISLASNENAAFSLSLAAVTEGGTGTGRTRFVVWIRDIQERKRREKFQREILSTTTHDLKGPLGAIMLSSELLLDGRMPPEKSRELALRIGSSAQSAVNLIDEFLSARRIQEGAFVLKPQLIDVRPSTENVIATFSTMAQAKRIKVEPQFQAASIEWLLDRLGYERMLGNLLSNAIKFTPKEGLVQVKVVVTDARLHVKVCDTGSGMEPSEVSRLFQRFSRLAKHEDIPGTGLGLFVVKNVVGAHGGTVEVTSQVGQGTCFDVTFPKDPPVNERGELIALDFA